MEKEVNRSLAYRLAKVIDNDSLSSISGGGQALGMQWCHKETFKASGTGPHSVDAVIDIAVDI